MCLHAMLSGVHLRLNPLFCPGRGANRSSKGNTTMAPQAAVSLKRTPLYELHRAAGAKFVDFGGWEMPVQYASIIEEHRAVRASVGLFDVSHMGEIEITGPRALEVVQRLTPNDASKLEVFEVQY